MEEGEFLFSPEFSRLSLEEKQKAIDYFSKFLAVMPYDLFLQFIFDNKIQGKDLFSLCLTNTTVDKKCNHREGKLFRSLLKEEFNQEYPKETTAQELRDLYFEYSQAKVWTFGYGLYGRLGHGDQMSQFIPKMIEGFSRIKAVSCGAFHTALLDQYGRVWTFGNGNLGQLGHDNRDPQHRPKLIEGFSGIKTIACGDNYTALLDQTGQVWTFGYGYLGKLGHGDEEDQLSPKMIKGFSGIKAVACGGSHTAFLDQAGQVWTFGHGSHGKLGHGDRVEKQPRPKMIEGFSGIQAVSCGMNHTAFLDQAGRVWTFGHGTFGRLGNGNEEDQFSPKMIEGFAGIKALACGDWHTALLDQYGRVWTFGRGNYGQLGHSDQEEQLRPKMIEGFSGIKAVACGTNHTAFLDQAGQVWTFGEGSRGQLGHGHDNREDQLRPKMIEGFSGIKAVACGEDHTAFLL